MYKIGVLALVALQAITISAQRCSCMRNIKPICGTDGVTYDNDCTLQCEQRKGKSVTKSYDGPCNGNINGIPCICPDNFNEVCGSNGQTYANDCLLNCATASDSTLKISHPGKCQTVNVVNLPSIPTCKCPSSVNPVCGSNGKTYNNDCLLNCATANDSSLMISHYGRCGNVNVATVPTPHAGCTCPRDMVPVCGSDGVTYNNLCLLECAGQTMARYGNC